MKEYKSQRIGWDDKIRWPLGIDMAIILIAAVVTKN